MGFNSQDFVRIRDEYSKKYLKAREAADVRREELYEKIPELLTLDRILSGTASRIMDAICSTNTEEGIAKVREDNEKLLEQRAKILAAYGYPADYTDVHYECELCGDTGYVDTKMCACMRRRLVEAGMESSGLGTLMRTQSFGNFSLDYYRKNPDEYARMEQNYKGLRAYAEGFAIEAGKPAPDSLLFFGGTGLGKTHLSTSVARKVIERGYDVFYNSAVGMISDFEFRRFGNSVAHSDGDNTERYTECDLLIIDDLGTEVINQFTLSCLYHVINTRLNLKKPTIISTNLSGADLRKAYSDRISSRLMGEFKLVPFYGTDVRRQKIQNG